MHITYLLLLQTIREMLGGVFDGFMQQITVLAEGTVTFLIMAAVYWCIHKRTGQLMACNVALACTLNQFLKAVCKVERPWVRDERIHPVEAALPAASGYSFPSGHTTRATAVYGSAALSARKHRGVSIVLWGLLALIMFSRNYLGVHTSWDVAGAFVIGMILLFLLDRILDWVEAGKNRDLIVCVAGCVLCFLPMLKVGCLSNAGAGMGFLLGWLAERRWISFSTDGKPVIKFVRFSCGALLIIAIQKILPPFLTLFMRAKYAGFFANMALALFIMVIWPMVFASVEQKSVIHERKRLIAVWIVVFAFLFVIGSLTAAFRVRALRIQSQQDAVVDSGQTPEITEQDAVVDSEQTPEITEPGAVSDPVEETLDPAIWRAENAGGLGMPEQPDWEEQGLTLIAHRGYSSEFPENTMPAFEGALDIGVDYIETDVQMTKDGRLVLFHDNDLMRITGVEGVVSDYTYEELTAMDAGGWFDNAYEGVRIPTLEELLLLLSDSDCRLYLELKDIGDVDGFVEKVYGEVEQYGLLDRCVFASFRYEYLERFKEINPDVKILFNIYNSSYVDATLTEQYPAEYYGLYTQIATNEVIEAIHASGSTAYIWTVDTPEELIAAKTAGADGIVTNYSGLMKVIRYQAYSFITDNYARSITLPGLYEPELPQECEDMVWQGLTLAGDGSLVVSAYSRSGQNSILYITDQNGHLQSIVDTGTKAHMGGIAYDGARDLLWMTGEAGTVWAAPWAAVSDGSLTGDAIVSFDAGLLNHNGSKVASFLGVNGDRLYVGSYVDGAAGCLNCYDISDAGNPQLISTVVIPERIQGVTFSTDEATGLTYMYLSQGWQMADAYLLKYEYRDETAVYAEPLERHVLPEGAEQILAASDGFYILFESAARPYRATSRIVNDQIYVLNLK
ncbi:MAG: phosphatase PAP2 family protein [Lachnospiraceae bacterium]|nr:phosphatase PAP2 family protein [Lachnospiraceae bacterium]